MKKPQVKFTPEQFAAYQKLVQTNLKIELKGATMPYTSLNGNMFSFLSESGLALRLPEKEREMFIKKYQTKLHVSGQSVLKEYADVPAKLLKNTKELKKYFDISWKYVQTIRPKSKK